MALLEVQSLKKRFGRLGRGGRLVVNEVSFTVERGEVVGLLGPNGAGKTTTFRMVMGMIAPDAGEVVFRGQVITGQPMYQRARLGVGYLSQESSIFRRLTVEQNIMAVLEAMKMTRQERLERCQELLSRLELVHLAKSRAENLSGGERRRLEITRALVTRPALILLDEPFSGVDPIAVFEIRNIILQLKRNGIGILLTDHSVREVLSITDRSYIINNGKVLVSGTPEEIIVDPRAKRVYLGETFAQEAAVAAAGALRAGDVDIHDHVRDVSFHIDDKELLEEFRRELEEEQGSAESERGPDASSTGPDAPATGGD